MCLIQVKCLSGKGWASEMHVSRVPCVGEKIRPAVPASVAGGARHVECVVTEVIHLDADEFGVVAIIVVAQRLVRQYVHGKDLEAIEVRLRHMLAVDATK